MLVSFSGFINLLGLTRSDIVSLPYDVAGVDNDDLSSISVRFLNECFRLIPLEGVVATSILLLLSSLAILLLLLLLLLRLLMLLTPMLLR